MISYLCILFFVCLWTVFHCYTKGTFWEHWFEVMLCKEPQGWFPTLFCIQESWPRSIYQDLINCHTFYVCCCSPTACVVLDLQLCYCNLALFQSMKFHRSRNFTLFQFIGIPCWTWSMNTRWWSRFKVLPFSFLSQWQLLLISCLVQQVLNEKKLEFQEL